MSRSSPTRSAERDPDLDAYWLRLLYPVGVMAAPGTKLRFTVYGHPHPKARPRAALTKQNKPYMAPAAGDRPAESAIARECQAEAARQRMSLPIDGRFVIRMAFYSSAKPTAAHPGDWDNLAKTVCDGLNGVAYADDSQIDQARVRVHRGVPKAEERTLVELEVIDG